MGRCGNGHEAPTGASFCSVCGSKVFDDGVAEPVAPTQHGPLMPVVLGAPAGVSSHVGPPVPPIAPPNSKRRWVLLGAAVAVALVVVGLVLSRSDDSQRTIRGTMTILDPSSVSGGIDDCQGSDGYDDLASGANVTVRDGDDHIVGSGRLENFESRTDFSRFLKEYDKETSQGDRSMSATLIDEEAICVLKFEIDVESADFYSIEVTHRGEQAESKKALEKSGWYVSYSIGGIDD